MLLAAAPQGGDPQAEGLGEEEVQCRARPDAVVAEDTL